MEPAQVAITIHDTISETGVVNNFQTLGVDHYFVVLGHKFWLPAFHNLRPGDRVKITITKEPDDALPR